jgi:hypothetical protein
LRIASSTVFHSRKNVSANFRALCASRLAPARLKIARDQPIDEIDAMKNAQK